jgi:hypothetical protein
MDTPQNKEGRCDPLSPLYAHHGVVVKPTPIGRANPFLTEFIYKVVGALRMVTVPSHVELDVRLREHFPTTRTLRFFFVVRPFYFYGGHSFYLL